MGFIKEACYLQMAVMSSPVERSISVVVLRVDICVYSNKEAYYLQTALTCSDVQCRVLVSRHGIDWLTEAENAAELSRKRLQLLVATQ